MRYAIDMGIFVSEIGPAAAAISINQCWGLIDCLPGLQVHTCSWPNLAWCNHLSRHQQKHLMPSESGMSSRRHLHDRRQPPDIGEFELLESSGMFWASCCQAAWAERSWDITGECCVVW